MKSDGDNAWFGECFVGDAILKMQNGNKKVPVHSIAKQHRGCVHSTL
jgi:hypothetical protein